MPLTVSSEAGTEEGDTTITVTPSKSAASNVYKYKVGTAAASVDWGDNVQNWSLWDGEADITAASGKVLTLVEATSDYKAIGAGSVTVVANAGE